MGLVNYILNTSMHDMRNDFNEYCDLFRRIRNEQRKLRQAYKNIVMDFGQMYYSVPHAKIMRGCVQKSWKWEFDWQMRMVVAREYEFRCPNCMLDLCGCNKTYCEYFPYINAYSDCLSNYKKIRDFRTKFWRNKFENVKKG